MLWPAHHFEAYLKALVLMGQFGHELSRRVWLVAGAERPADVATKDDLSAAVECQLHIEPGVGRSGEI